MATPKPRTTRSRSHRDIPDLEKMDAAYSWDALEWTKIEVSSSFFLLLYLRSGSLRCTPLVNALVFFRFSCSLFRGRFRVSTWIACLKRNKWLLRFVVVQFWFWNLNSIMGRHCGVQFLLKFELRGVFRVIVYWIHLLFL